MPEGADVRHAAKRDYNETEIVEALHKAGCLTLKLNEFDRLAYRGGRLFMLEIKNVDGKNKLTALQEELIARGWPLKIVRSPIEALAAVGL